MQRGNRFQFGQDVTRAIADAKREWQTGNRSSYLKPHEGHELANVVRRGPGSSLWECQVGNAHPGDASPAGRRRVVVWEDSGQLKRFFFTDDHYRFGSWYEITDA